MGCVKEIKKRLKQLLWHIQNEKSPKLEEIKEERITQFPKSLWLNVQIVEHSISISTPAQNAVIIEEDKLLA